MEAEPAGPPDAPQRPPGRPFACRRPASPPAPLPTHGPRQHVGGKGQPSSGRARLASTSPPPRSPHPSWPSLLPLIWNLLLSMFVDSSVSCLISFFSFKEKSDPVCHRLAFRYGQALRMFSLVFGLPRHTSPASGGPCSPVAPESSSCCSSAFNSAVAFSSSKHPPRGDRLLLLHPPALPLRPLCRLLPCGPFLAIRVSLGSLNLRPLSGNCQRRVWILSRKSLPSFTAVDNSEWGPSRPGEPRAPHLRHVTATRPGAPATTPEAVLQLPPLARVTRTSLVTSRTSSRPLHRCLGPGSRSSPQHTEIASRPISLDLRPQPSPTITMPARSP